MVEVEVFEQDGLTCKLFVDEDPSSPADWDQLATFLTWGRDAADVFGSAGEAVGEPYDSAAYVRALSIFGGAAAVLPLRVSDYGSSGIWVSVADADDCNAVAVTTHKRVSELCGDDPSYHERAWILSALEGELDEWRKLFEGDVYGYVVEDSRGELLDSCWGFYGLEYAIEEGKSMLAWHVAEQFARIGRAIVGASFQVPA